MVLIQASTVCDALPLYRYKQRSGNRISRLAAQLRPDHFAKLMFTSARLGWWLQPGIKQ
jgi:hypothetical protein